MRSVAMKLGGDVIDISGDWGVWGGMGEQPPPERPERWGGRQPNRRAEWASGELVVGEIANLDALMTYAESGVDRRQARLIYFIEYHEERGSIGADGRSRLQKVYTKELIAGTPIGRMCAGGIPIRNWTCEARVAARADFCEDIDFPSPRPNCTFAIPHDIKLE